ncbi:MAG: signal peptide peptidase SppA [Myxococcota bacterium]
MHDPNVPLPAPPPQPPARPKGMSPAVMLFLGCGGFLTLGFLGIFVLAVLGGDHASIDDAAVLRMKLSGEVPEFVRTSGFDELFGSPPITVLEHVENLKKAAADKRIKGVLIELEPLLVGYAKVEELRDALTEFKKSGKFVVVYSEYLTEKEYALALAADEIVMPKDSWFEFNGLATDIAHYPGLLEKAGIEVQYFRYGKYKSVSGEQTGRKAFTEPVKEMINDNLAVVYGHLVDAIAAARKLDKAEVERLMDESGLKADWAFEHKLIDRLAYYDEVETTLREKLSLKEDKKVPFVSSGRYRGVSPKEAGLAEGDHTFALIYSVGLIVAGRGDSGGLGDDGTQGSIPIIRALRKAAEDEDVKAIIFRVDSPGGAGLGCDYVRREIERIREKKPVIVSMSDVAASGGYWVSMDANAIVAQPSTATGSIGIYSVVPSLGGLYDKLALNNETFKKGAHADALIAARLMTEDEAKRFDDDLKRSYDRFVELAAKGRDMNVDAMQEVAQGRTWYGSQAATNGLVDKLGGFDAAIALGKEKAKLPADATVKLERFDKRKSWFEELTGPTDEDDEESPELGRALVKQVVDATGLGPLVKRVPFFSSYVRLVLEGKERVFPMMELHVDYR